MKLTVMGVVAAAVIASAFMPASAAEHEVAACAALAPVYGQFALQAKYNLDMLRAAKLDPKADCSKVFDGPELDATENLAEVYGPLLPQYEAFAERMVVFAATMGACAAAQP